ncbi:MAG: hypothetical protein U0798_15445 [Gemmataceae bacterium]
MSAPPIALLDRGVRSARRRLITQLLVNRLAVAWSIALALGLVWILVEPLLFSSVNETQKWYVIGGLFALATTVVVGLTARFAPTQQTAALEFDGRFALNERVTTALSLDEASKATPAGQAVMSDALQKVASIKVREKFPVKPRWHAMLPPTFAAMIVLAWIYATPDRVRQLMAGEESTTAKLDPLAVAKTEAKKPTSTFTKIRTRDELDRTNKSEKLKELEADLEKLNEKFDRDRDMADPNKAREKVTELTKLEDKMKQFKEEKFQKLAQLDQKMQELERLSRDPDFSDGPAKELNNALAKGDLKKAREEVDELKKKAKKGEMNEQDKQKLEKQMEKMKNEVERLAKDREKEKKLEDMIKKAKEQGKDAESLERELEQMKKENASSEREMEELAQKMKKAQEALQQGNMEDLADQLEKIGSQLKEMDGDLKDLEDVEQYLQNLKQEKKKACKECNGNGDCEGDEAKEKDYAKWSEKGRPGMGKRGEEKDDTSSIEEKQKGLFDPRGKKVYGGGVRGPAFTKKSSVELGKQIQEAVQEAPSAVDAQRLPRDARDSVKEYFENLGGSTPKK